jgi:coenzyme PQQ precursor peptide PqqA
LTAKATNGELIPAGSRRNQEDLMAWTTPVIIETPCGAEINLYISAEI